MYLEATIIVSPFSGTEPFEENLQKIREFSKASEYGTDEAPYVQIKYPLVYWRKANHIHKWFVENVQEGEDDCRNYTVDIEQLSDLRDLAKIVRETGDTSLLPRLEGFFFGSNEIDDDYWADLDRTISEIERVLEIPTNSFTFITYTSSW